MLNSKEQLLQQGFRESDVGRLIKDISFFFNGKKVVFQALVEFLSENQNEARARLYLNKKEITIYNELKLLDLFKSGHYGSAIMEALLDFERCS